MRALTRILLLALWLPIGSLHGWEDRYTFKQVDPELPAYAPMPELAGTLNSVGSDTLNNLMSLWAEAFQAIYPDVRIQIEGKGSSTAPPALIEGSARLGPMSREMKHTEIDAFEARHGYKPFRISVALDALSVYVHKDNPIEGLSLRQLDAIFSSTFKQGGTPITTWGQLGLQGAWAPRSISIYGRNSASGTYGFFKQIALGRGDFKSTMKEQPGSSAVVQGISTDVYGIGYSGIGYRTSRVRPLALADGDGVLHEPTIANCISGDYPLARLLHIYVNKSPVNELDPLTREFLKFVLSRDGQRIVIRDGYYPLPARIARQFVDALEN
jgi:phosphate transport system substrate-binding protein